MRHIHEMLCLLDFTKQEIKDDHNFGFLPTRVERQQSQLSCVSTTRGSRIFVILNELTTPKGQG